MNIWNLDTDDEKYKQGWHDALEKQGEKKEVKK